MIGMNAQQFVDMIRHVVRDGAELEILSNLLKPPGRQPAPAMLQKSEWYHQLGEVDRALVQEVIKDSVHHAVFGFLCVLDGVRAFDDSEDGGSLELFYASETIRCLLNSPEAPMLHDLLRE